MGGSVDTVNANISKAGDFLILMIIDFLRIFWTRIKFDSGADRKVEKLDDQIWKRVAPSSVKDLPVLHGKHSETDNISGQVLNYEVQIFQNFAGTDFSRSSA